MSRLFGCRSRISSIPLLLILAGMLHSQDATEEPLHRLPQEPARSTGTVTADGYQVDGCVVQFISEPILAFEEPGVVVSVPKEGDRVEKDDIVASLNDEEVLRRIDVAQFAYDAARIEADSDIRVRYAQMQAQVALADRKSGEEANRKTPNVVPEMEMRRRDAEYRSGVLGIENAKHELAIAAATARVKDAELKATQILLKRLQLKSPITGIVTEKMRDEGEYVRAGDPVVRVGQLDRLRVEGRIAFKDMPPGEPYGRSVRIEIPVGIDAATGNPLVETFDSQIQHVAADIDIEDMYRVWAEIDNRDDFVVRPGMQATMTILN